MNISPLLRILSFTWQSFWRNKWLSLVTITVMTLAFLSINFLITLNIATDAALNIIQDKIDVSIYFKTDVNEAQVQEVETFLSSLTEVKSITQKTQAQALDEFRQAHQNDLLIVESLEELDENPLGATLIVKAKDSTHYPKIIDVIENSKYDELILTKNFDDNKIYINQINEVSSNIQIVGLATTILFALIALLIIFNTIRIAVYTHRREIAIMKLVGATNWFISSPFLLESLLYGFISAIVGIVVIYLSLNVLQPHINSFFQTSQVDIIGHFNANFWQIFGLEILIIALLSVLSSSIAIRRYLKV